VEAGKIRVLALTSSAPSTFAPGIPTAAQAGYPALTFDGLIGWLGPRGMSAELRERIAADVRSIAADSAITERLGAIGQVVSPGTPADFAAAIEAQYETVARIGQALGIKPATQ
jgi:tripartite-type tricarboxylate transporter receptor subunit TctC